MKMQHWIALLVIMTLLSACNQTAEPLALSCAEQNGSTCLEDELCSAQLLNASDSAACCSVTCTTFDEQLAALNVSINPLLWEIKGEKPSYLFGTVHFSDEDVLTLPNVVIDAMDSCGELATEVDFNKLDDVDIEASIFLPEGQRLEQLLPTDVYNKLDRYLLSEGLSVLFFSEFKIWVVAFFLDGIDEIETERPILDDYLAQRAANQAKYVSGLESLSESDDAFNALTVEEQTIFLNETLNSLINDTLSEEELNIKGLYFYGDENLLVLEPAENDTSAEAFIDRLVAQRNSLWAERIEQKITDEPTLGHCFVFGAGHLPGEEGMLSLLAQRGFSLERVPFPTAESCEEGEVLIDSRCYVPPTN